LREDIDVSFIMDSLDDTRAAFDSVAANYDGPRGNNDLIQHMRREMWRWLDESFPRRSKLLDLGCGTGLDAVRMAEQGHEVLATDWSPRMVERAHGRAADAGLSGRVHTAAIGAHELARIEGRSLFDGVYSNLGPLNCLPDLAPVSRECARLVKAGGRLVFTVIGRWCPWEIAYYARRADWTRIGVRFARGMTPVRMNGHTVWTRYWTPGGFYRSFAREFALVHCRALCLFAPPPYMTGLRDRHPAWFERLELGPARRRLAAAAQPRRSFPHRHGEAMSCAQAGGTHVGAEYVRAIQQCESDRRAREAFQSLALALVPPGGTIFDLGAGAGIDAAFFAERGLRVRAYDHDPRMRSYLAAACREPILAGRILPETGEYAEFLARTPDPALPQAHLVIANFAPLDLIGDLPALFAKLHTVTVPGAAMLASVLSPYYLGDLTFGWRWRGLLGQLRTGTLTVPGAQGDIIRRCLRVFAADCAPWFELERVFRGLPPRHAAEAAGIDFAPNSRTAWLRLTRCRFMFLLFRRQSRC
jgi:SAM-dependent methyltransferase